MEEVHGKRVLVRFDGSKCIHSRGCVLDRPDVFVPNVEGEWIHPDNATPEEMLELARNCPSGAIQVERTDGGAAEAAPKVNTVRVRENGPYALRGKLTIAGQPAGTRATLCRCGHSQNKPYCDGAHAGAGFVATGEVVVRESHPLAHRDGELVVKPAPDGPLLVEGNLEVLAGSGHTVDRVSKCALCRCGQSSNKPYCDGTHRKTSFRAP